MIANLCLSDCWEETYACKQLELFSILGGSSPSGMHACSEQSVSRKNFGAAICLPCPPVDCTSHWLYVRQKDLQQPADPCSNPKARSLHQPLEPREGEPRQTNKASWGPLWALGAYSALLGRLGSPSSASIMAYTIWAEAFFHRRLRYPLLCHPHPKTRPKRAWLKTG